jgi:hypothetical protein
LSTPTCSDVGATGASDTGSLPGDEIGKTTANETHIAETMAKTRFERADRKQVLRGARIAATARDEPGQEHGYSVGERACCLEADYLGDLKTGETVRP